MQVYNPSAHALLCTSIRVWRHLHNPKNLFTNEKGCRGLAENMPDYPVTRGLKSVCGHNRGSQVCECKVCKP